MYKDDETEAWAIKEKKRKGVICGNHLFMGFCAELAERVAKSVNFTYEICLVKDDKYGAVNENESWNGMVGELTRGVSQWRIWRSHDVFARENYCEWLTM